MRNNTGAVIDGWDRFDAFNIYGVKPSAAVGRPSESQSLARTAGPSVAERNSDKPWHPDSPLFWFGLVLATTFGLIGASTSIRVGPFKAAVAAGK